ASKSPAILGSSRGGSSGGGARGIGIDPNNRIGRTGCSTGARGRHVEAEEADSTKARGSCELRPLSAAAPTMFSSSTCPTDDGNSLIGAALGGETTVTTPLKTASTSMS
ncbi:MAG: hypothetical protein ACKPKO_10935, partial [Candidatus Fonsibacter sp.]